MKEILFRAKSIEKYKRSEWVEGYIFDDGYENGRIFVGSLEIQEYKGCACNDWDIVGTCFYEVDPSTICQYIGLTDRHENKLWENDIVEIVSSPKTSYKYLLWWNKEMSLMDAIPLDGLDFNGHDYWNGNYPNFHYETFCTMMQDPWGDFSDIKVIGNIIDNPELIDNK